MSPMKIAIVSTEEKVGNRFIEELGIVSGSAAQIFHGDVAHDVLGPILPDQQIPACDMIAVILRHVDFLTLQAIEAQVNQADSQILCAVVLFRDAGVEDFKMSCLSCTQKLWVRDQDVGKRGRCPKCKKAFTLPIQRDHLLSQLTLNPGYSLAELSAGNVKENVDAILRILRGEDEFDHSAFNPKGTTMLVELPDDE